MNWLWFKLFYKFCTLYRYYRTLNLRVYLIIGVIYFHLTTINETCQIFILFCIFKYCLAKLLFFFSFFHNLDIDTSLVICFLTSTRKNLTQNEQIFIFVCTKGIYDIRLIFVCMLHMQCTSLVCIRISDIESACLEDGSTREMNFAVFRIFRCCFVFIYCLHLHLYLSPVLCEIVAVLRKLNLYMRILYMPPS